MLSSATPLETTDRLFFGQATSSLDRQEAEHITSEALHGADDGELYLEYRESEMLSLDDGRIRMASSDTALGFGLRAVSDEATGYAHAGEITRDTLKRAAETVSAVRSGHSGESSGAPRATNQRLYSDENPLRTTDFAVRTRLLSEIDAYARGKDPRVIQVMASMAGEWQAVQIIRADGSRVADSAPPRAPQRGRGGRAGRAAGNRQLWHRRPFQLRAGDGRGGMARGSRRGFAAGSAQPRQRRGTGGRDGGRARLRLARHSAA